MAQIALTDILPVLQSFVTNLKTELTASDRLSDMGVDSLTTINIIVTAAETLGLDLERLEEITEAPATISDLISIMNRLQVSVGVLANGD